MAIPKEIEDARALLEKAQSIHDPAQKISTLEQAIDLLDSYVEEHSDLPGTEKTLIVNIRRSHTRHLINRLSLLHGVDMEVGLTI
jgi:hypothetical protein